MAVTVFVDERSVVHRKAGGEARTTAPDVCYTPIAGAPVPLPYLNVASDADTSKGSKTVFMDGCSIMLKGSEFSKSSGDEPGSAGGIVSGVNRGPAHFISYSFDVKAEGKNVPRHRDFMAMNGTSGNTVGMYQRTYGKRPGYWDMDCVLKILCDKDPALVKKLNALKKLKTFEEIYWMDDVYDGTSWTKKKFPGGGYNSRADKEIGLTTKGSCEDGAVTVKHELVHQDQAAGMLMADAEDAAYLEAEQWAIDNGLPSQWSNFRITDAAGKVVPDYSAIQDMVREEYPVPKVKTGPPPPQVIGKTAKGESIVRDPTTGAKSVRPPQKGDSIPGPQSSKGEQDIDPKSLKCP